MPSNDHPAQISSTWGLAACWLLAVIFLSTALCQTYQIKRLLTEGQQTTAHVIGIDKGVKGLKYAVLNYQSYGGADITANDKFPMMFIRHKVNDQVNVIYHSKQNNWVTIDLGLWTWQQPAMFYLGFIILVVLGIVIPRTENKKDT